MSWFRRRASTSRRTCSGRGCSPRILRDLEQLVVRGPRHGRLQRAVPGGRGATSARSSPPRSPRPAPRRCSRRWPARQFGLTRGSVRPGSPPRPRPICSAGRLAFAFGALRRWRPWSRSTATGRWLACALAVLTALCSPVAALFAALAGAAYAIGTYVRVGELRPALPGVAIAIASLLPVGLLRDRFPEGRHEPFAFSALWPIPLVAAGLLLALPRDALILRAGVVLYTLGTIVSYMVATPIGSNAARLERHRRARSRRCCCGDGGPPGCSRSCSCRFYISAGRRQSETS